MTTPDNAEHFFQIPDRARPNEVLSVQLPKALTPQTLSSRTEDELRLYLASLCSDMAVLDRLRKGSAIEPKELVQLAVAAAQQPEREPEDTDSEEDQDNAKEEPDESPPKRRRRSTVVDYNVLAMSRSNVDTWAETVTGRNGQPSLLAQQQEQERQAEAAEARGLDLVPTLLPAGSGIDQQQSRPQHGWERHLDDREPQTPRFYWWNRHTGASQWQQPEVVTSGASPAESKMDMVTMMTVEMERTEAKRAAHQQLKILFAKRAADAELGDAFQQILRGVKTALGKATRGAAAEQVHRWTKGTEPIPHNKMVAVDGAIRSSLAAAEDSADGRSLLKTSVADTCRQLASWTTRHQEVGLKYAKKLAAEQAEAEEKAKAAAEAAAKAAETKAKENAIDLCDSSDDEQQPREERGEQTVAAQASASAAAAAQPNKRLECLTSSSLSRLTEASAASSQPAAAALAKTTAAAEPAAKQLEVDASRELRELFELFDTDSDGLLSKDEYTAYLQATGEWGTGWYTDARWDDNWAKECEQMESTTDGISREGFESILYGKYRTGKGQADLERCKAALGKHPRASAQDAKPREVCVYFCRSSEKWVGQVVGRSGRFSAGKFSCEQAATTAATNMLERLSAADQAADQAGAPSAAQKEEAEPVPVDVDLQDAPCDAPCEVRSDPPAPADAELIEAVRSFMKAHKVTQTALGQEARVSQAVISQWLAKKYTGHNDKVRTSPVRPRQLID